MDEYDDFIVINITLTKENFNRRWNIIVSVGCIKWLEYIYTYMVVVAVVSLYTGV